MDYQAAEAIRDKVQRRIRAEKEFLEERAAIQEEGSPTQQAIRILTASEWMLTPLPPADQIIAGLFDLRDKFAIIGGSKTRKTFFSLQMILSLATGRPFLLWHVPKARTVVHVQYEITERHFLERLIRMARALGIDREELTNLHIINARGLNLTGKRGIDQISKSISNYKPEVILFDPLYKIHEGVENAAEDMKIILSQFDHLAEETSAAVGYVHHDPKGQAGDRSTRDRGAGSNVLSRDYDAAFVLTEHTCEEDAVVLEMLLRNYRPQEPFVVQWSEDDETGGYCFQAREDIAPEKKASKRAAQPAFLSYLAIAQSILENNEMEIGVFKSIFKQRSGLSDNRIKDFLTWAQSGGKPHLTTREERARKTHKKWIRVSGNMFNE